MLSYKTVLLALLLSSSSLALPIRREVPQEHSHQPILDAVQASLVKNNPNGIVDAVFGLLGNAAAAGGLGKLTDANCLQQATADQAFTNAKAAGDVDGQVNALIYRALERNSGTVGGTTTACATLKAVNPEIAALQQHQDPASNNAATVNKAIELELAKQIASVGGDPQDALKSATFAPGDVNDKTGKGNTCDDANDKNGCGFTLNLFKPAASAAEIDAAVAGVKAGNGAAAGSGADSTDCSGTLTVTVTATGGGAAATEVAETSSAADAAATGATGGASTSIGDFGKCSIPQIEFAAGFDNRKETSFQPVDKQSFDHGSAQAIKIITQAICDGLVNTCGADATAKATCAAAKAAADAAPPKQGIDADIFNGFFGIATNFRDIQAIDDQGKPIAGTTGGSVSVANVGAGAAAATSPAAAAPATAAPAVATPAPAVDVATGSFGDFGKCSVPQIEFAAGFDGRRETSFQPVDKQSFNHGSAQAIGIITQAICDGLVNNCGADATAKATCAAAKAAADAAPPKQGIDADTFNGFFGIATNFRNVQAIDDQGRPIAGTTGGSVTVAKGGAAAPAAPAAPAATAAPATAAAPAATQAAGSSAAAGGNFQTFTGALGGVAAPPVQTGGKGFVVNGSDFLNKAAALGRSCDVQHNGCANAANSGGAFSVGDCDKQNNDCHAAI
ncbi:hypothetical protein R3P38DRAFT_3256962 [Favolaschia claudopus]|uniref:Cell wall mannoprotein n=1 Tax=Favolaschia claudopus TaxID=2862362 RepID=A0AAW0DCF2_9AGAR